MEEGAWGLGSQTGLIVDSVAETRSLNRVPRKQNSRNFRANQLISWLDVDKILFRHAVGLDVDSTFGIL